MASNPLAMASNVANSKLQQAVVYTLLLKTYLKDVSMQTWDCDHLDNLACHFNFLGFKTILRCLDEHVLFKVFG